MSHRRDVLKDAHETAQRLRKARIIAVHLQSMGITAEKAETLTNRNWQEFAETAGVRKPSGQTREFVIAKLKFWELWNAGREAALRKERHATR